MGASSFISTLLLAVLLALPSLEALAFLLIFFLERWELDRPPQLGDWQGERLSLLLSLVLSLGFKSTSRLGLES